MLDTNTIGPYLERRQNDQMGTQDPSFSTADLLAALRRQWVILTVCALVGLSAGGVFLAVFKPNFQAAATILIDTRKYPETLHTEVVARAVYDSSAAIDTQVEILKSQALAQAVVDKLKLWDEPEFVKSGGGVRTTVLSLLHLDSAVPPPTEAELRGRAIGYFIKHLTVKRVADSYAIDIIFEAAHADVAAAVANATAAAFIEWQRTLYRTALTSAGDWLEERINDLGQKTAAEQKAVAEYQAKNNVYSVGGGDSDEKRIAELNTQLTAARSQLTDAQVRLTQLTRAIGENDKHPSDLEIMSAIENAYPAPTVATMRTQYMELKTRYDQLAKVLPATHQALADLRSQLSTAHAALLAELNRVKLLVENNRETAQEKVRNLQEQIDSAIQESRSAATAQAALKRLEANAQTYQTLYDSFMRRYAEALQADGSPVAEAKVISPADPPPARNYKKALIIFAAFPGLALALGGAIAFTRERISRPFWTTRDVERELSLPCADAVPALSPKELNAARTKAAQEFASLRASGQGPGLLNGTPLGYYALLNPLSRFAESLRSVRVALNVGHFEGARRAVGITSAMPNEGKSSMALALAASAAGAGVNTILVDCDIRNPTVTKSWFGTTRVAGIVDVLKGSAELQQVISTDPISNLHFVPSGLMDSRNRVVDLLTNERFTQLMLQLKSQYDLVVVDLPPMAPIVDVAAAQKFIDGYLLVIEWGQTRVGSINYALQKMPHVNEGAISVILNKVNIKKMAKFGFYLGDYYANQHEDRYLKV